MNTFNTKLVTIVEEAGNYSYGFNKKTNEEMFKCNHPEGSDEYYALLDRCRMAVKDKISEENED